MFFNLVRKNSKRSRKSNSLLFISLIVAIIAFYIILSLEHQDVIIFLKTIESDAVSRLLKLMPIIYGVSLFMLFFLIYFAGKYQLERRNHEFGTYLMLGMNIKRLFFMLLVEDIWSSFISIITGIPIAIFISEMISMITAKIVGLGIIGRNTSFSINAVILTIVGYFLIRLIAILILSLSIMKKDIIELLSENQEKKQKKFSILFTSIKLIMSLFFLSIAYFLVMNQYAWVKTYYMLITVILGICGTFLFFNSIGLVFEKIIKNSKYKKGLNIFSFRQLQEHVFFKSGVLAVSSLLFLAAFSCFAYGVSVSFNASIGNRSEIHYTFRGEEEKIKSELKKFEIDKHIDELFDVRIGEFRGLSSMGNLLKAIESQQKFEDVQSLLAYMESPYAISLSGYNNILKIIGKDTIELKENQVALYYNEDFDYGNYIQLLNKVLKENINIEIGNESYKLVEDLYVDKLITDRIINIVSALIIPDDVFDRLIELESEDYYWNMTLKEEFIKDKGLMQGIMSINKLLDTTNINYESYLQNTGRKIFYYVAGSYTTIYIGVILLIIANVILGMQFLMKQQKARKRYLTLIYLGCGYNDLCKSERKQIRWYFMLPILIATIGSVFGVMGLFEGLSSESMKNQITTLIAISMPVIVLLFAVELVYTISVMKISDRQIKDLIEIKRENS